MAITADRVRQVLNYDAATGALSWRVSTGKKARVGCSAGRASPGGGNYVRVGIDGQRYLAHRIIWLWVHGVWPERLIDHINGDTLDNRLFNLREADDLGNGRNKGVSRNNTSGEPGVYWHDRAEKWGAAITVNRESIHLGLFSRFEDAITARRAAARRYHGEFAAIASRQSECVGSDFLPF